MGLTLNKGSGPNHSAANLSDGISLSPQSECEPVPPITSCPNTEAGEQVSPCQEAMSRGSRVTTVATSLTATAASGFRSESWSSPSIILYLHPSSIKSPMNSRPRHSASSSLFPSSSSSIGFDPSSFRPVTRHHRHSSPLKPSSCTISPNHHHLLSSIIICFP